MSNSFKVFPHMVIPALELPASRPDTGHGAEHQLQRHSVLANPSHMSQPAEASISKFAMGGTLHMART